LGAGNENDVTVSKLFQAGNENEVTVTIFKLVVNGNDLTVTSGGNDAHLCSVVTDRMQQYFRGLFCKKIAVFGPNMVQDVVI
jgi:hypothetical protein